MPLPSIQVVMEEVTDPQEIAEAQAQMEQARRNSDWMQVHAHEIYTQHRGKFIVVAGEELFVADTPEEANALARAAHPEDKGSLGRYIYPQKWRAFMEIEGERQFCKDRMVMKRKSEQERYSLLLACGFSVALA